MLRRVVWGLSRVGPLVAALSALALGLLGFGNVKDELGRAFWSTGCAVMLLVLAWEARPTGEPRPRCDVDWRSYGIASLVLAAMTCFGASGPASIVVASVAFSLLGMLMLLVCLRIPCPLAIGLLLVQSVLFLSWPVWGSSLLARFDLQWLVDRLVSVGPLFAINGAINPTDAFTHRPLAYRLMNLGQDIPYEMPRTIWPCVILHLATGLPGMLWTALRTRPLPYDRSDAPK